jgi:hypothetical protein
VPFLYAQTRMTTMDEIAANRGIQLRIGDSASHANQQ